MIKRILSGVAAYALVVSVSLALTATSQAQIVGGRITSITQAEEPQVQLPSDQPTFMTSINYPLIYGAYAVWPYAIPTTFSNGTGLPSRMTDLSMRPTPVITRAYRPGLAPPATSAYISAVVPANAELWFEGMQVPGSGNLRKFTSPELDPLKSYTYDVRASWYENGRVITQAQRLLVRSGDRLTVTFPATRPPIESGPALRTPGPEQLQMQPMPAPRR
jgi:uncharacterized protein (TIGR03000 family)